MKSVHHATEKYINKVQERKNYYKGICILRTMALECKDFPIIWAEGCQWTCVFSV